MPIRSGALTAGVVATVTLSGNFEEVEILNRSGTDEIWYTLDGSDPSEDGNDIDILPATISSTTHLLNTTSESSLIIKLLSNSLGSYTIAAR